MTEVYKAHAVNESMRQAPCWEVTTALRIYMLVYAAIVILHTCHVHLKLLFASWFELPLAHPWARQLVRDKLGAESVIDKFVTFPLPSSPAQNLDFFGLSWK